MGRLKRKIVLILLSTFGGFLILQFLILNELGTTFVNDSNTDSATLPGKIEVGSSSRGNHARYNSISNFNMIGKHPGAELLQNRLHPVFPARPSEELEGNIVPNVVHYVICGNVTFTFNHYLSVMSIWKFLEPDAIEIHAEYPPIQDTYNTWLDDVKDSISSLTVRQFPKYWNGMEAGCGAMFALAVIEERGGIYVADDIVLLKSMTHFRKDNFTAVYDTEGGLKMVFSTEKHRYLAILKNNEIFKSAFTEKRFVLKGSFKNACDMVRKLDTTLGEAVNCIILNISISPKDIIGLKAPLASYLREIYYGVKDVILPRVNTVTSIPKIVHYVWYHPANMTFIMYLSLVSTLHIIQPEKVFIHGDGPLVGRYWDKVKHDPRISLVYRETPLEIFGNRILYTHHKSDVLRADILLKYGGIYLDWDVIWLKPVDDLIDKGYDVILNFDHMPRPNYPDSINMGVVLSKPRSRFLELWRDTYKTYKSMEFFHNPIELPYKVYERHPDLAYIEKRLQVMCFRLKCHPLFHKDYKDYMESQPFDWRTDVYSIHFTFPDPLEFTNEDTLRNGTGMFADIGRYIMEQSGSPIK